MNSGFLKLIKQYDKVLAKGESNNRRSFIFECRASDTTWQTWAISINKPRGCQHLTNSKQRNIYIEQAIRGMTCFRIFRNDISLTLLHHLDDIVCIVAGLCNLYPSLPRYRTMQTISSKCKVRIFLFTRRRSVIELHLNFVTAFLRDSFFDRINIMLIFVN